MTEEEIEERFRELSFLKIHPRDQEENKLLRLKCERPVSYTHLIMEGNRIKIGTSYRVKRMGLLWMKNRYGLFWG